MRLPSERPDAGGRGSSGWRCFGVCEGEGWDGMRAGERVGHSSGETFSRLDRVSQEFYLSVVDTTLHG
ncbi:hypothetical protein PsYK624_134840 [Phanerochaete sordida]|uniref:Uncharacterized protein n=1 Tax=Phanerochaete sordida TaxID=48140 RepID=A0A9P3GLR0_9APHY|nr:hypothetical protein PsYK624_134840 [Phanerochaete sordida]